MTSFKLNKDTTLFLFIDIQDKLLKAIDHHDDVLKKAQILADMANIMHTEALFTAQYPKGLGYNHSTLKAALPEAKEIEKTAFSCMLEPEFVATLKETGKKQIVVSGIEAHICVLLTVRDLIEAGYEVFVAADAVGSRDPHNKDNALSQMAQMGACVTNVETVMFDLNSISGTAEFKAVQKLIL
ncbi:isochorismatase family protein [Peptoniphilus equinus]|uniref:Isochorismatase family protein n=1 Tax=Peptoniphilus equinus TaxID=3016343 RepID=A0ABY7QUV5_9FIRM|nr:isochorismatase family protein [Peptoniphilus equinus]WBW49678.1 isochorismatase family protein [Peptoniphilus equinus]